jgi:DNA-binding MarR family transcriptional regulator
MSKQHEEAPRSSQIPADLVAALNAHSEAVVLFHSAVAQSMGLDPSAYKTLFLLSRLGPLSAGEIARETGLATASVTDLIDRLVGKGYVSRSHHPTDRRRIVVTLIEDSVTNSRRDFGVPNPSLAELCERYDSAQLELIADFLKRNAQRLRDDLADALV